MNSGVLLTAETGSEGIIRMFHTRSDDEGRMAITGKPVTGLKWSPQWGIFASHSDNSGTWDILTHDLSKTVAEFPGHSDGILNLAASPDGDMAVTISSDETLRVWELGQSLSTPNQSPRFRETSQHTPRRATPITYVR